LASRRRAWALAARPVQAPLHHPNVNARARRSKLIRCGLSQHRAEVRAAVQFDVADAVCGGSQKRSVALRGNAVPARVQAIAGSQTNLEARRCSIAANARVLPDCSGATAG